MTRPGFELLRIPSDFWSRDAVRIALRSRDIGMLFRLIKRYTAASQSRIGVAVGFEQGRVSKMMAGNRVTSDIGVFERIADGLEMPDPARVQLGIAPKIYMAPGTDTRASGRVSGSVDLGISTASGSISGTAELEEGPVRRRDFLALSGLGALDPRVLLSSYAQVNSRDVSALRERTARLRRLDDYLGGADTFGLYIADLNSTEALTKGGRFTDGVRHELLCLMAEQAQQAGWAAFDAGNQAEARRLYELSLSTAIEAQDHSLASNALALLAYRTAEPAPADEIEAVKDSVRIATGREAPMRVQALLYERRAWLHATSGDARETARALDAAESAINSGHNEESPDWASWVDHNEIQIMSGRCWTVLQRPLRAVPILENVLGQYSDTHARDKSLYSTWLAEAYLDAHEVEQSAVVLRRAMDLSENVSSVRPKDRITTVLRRLKPHQNLSSIAELFDWAAVG